MKSPNIRVVVCIAAAVIVLSSCGLKTIGEGVLLWSPDEQTVSTGDTVPIVKESEIENSYTVALGEEETLDIPKWRIQFFETTKELEEYRRNHEAYLRLIGRAKVDSLAVRAEPDVLAQRVYKLRKLEIVKITDRSAEKDAVGDYEDYWYQVLTKDGTEGWCYGESLIIQSIGEEFDASILEQEEDPLIQSFLDNVWRPEYFRSYIDDGTIDLEEFRADIGIFPNPEEQTILHVTKRSSNEYTYSDIVNTGGSLYLFTGTPVKVQMYAPDRMMFDYLENGKSVQKLYLKIDENIEELVQKEQERRWDQYEYLTEKGTTFSSTAYGTISFPGFTKFEWTDFDRLIPDVIPPGIREGSGKLEFSLFLGDALKGKYDGALQLTFTEKKENPLSFLYKRTESGLQFIYAPPSTRTGIVVEREPSAPIVMFFSVQGE